MKVERAWERLRERVAELRELRGVAGLLHWDEAVQMPPGGAEARGRQKAALARLRHERLIDPDLGEWLDVLAHSDDPLHRAAVRNLGLQRGRALRLPAALVRERAEASSAAFALWRQARAEEAPTLFAPALRRMVELAREEAACLGQGGPAYDAHLAGYDPGLRLARVEQLFEPLARGLRALLDEVRRRGPPPALRVAMPAEEQRRLLLALLPRVGFQLERGRLDTAPHPFCVGLDPYDVRLTTRYDEGDLMSAVLATLHEAGHGLYEQGLPLELRGSTVDEAASTSLHEANSRLWENGIGRSLPFLRWFCGLLAEQGGPALDPRALWASCNRVEPGFIRVEADEVSYNLHILLRTRLEVALLDGQLTVEDLPLAWEEQSLELLGLRPPRPSLGHLQDIHWASGLFGYFPTYTVGNLYAATLLARMEEALPGLWAQVERGELGAVLGFLRTEVHAVGHRDEAEAIIARIAPGRDPVEDLLARLRRRQEELAAA